MNGNGNGNLLWHRAKEGIKSWHGVALCLLIVIALQLINERSTETIIALVYIAVAYCAFNHTIGPSIVCSLIVIGYVIVMYANGNIGEWQLVFNIVAIVFVSSGIVWQKWYNHRFDNSNNLRAKIEEANTTLNMLLDSLSGLRYNAIRQVLIAMQDQLGNALAMTKGWQQISEEQFEIERRLRNDAVSAMIEKFKKDDNRPDRN